MLRRALVLVISSLLAAQAWPSATPLGYVDSASSASVASIQAVTGANVFNGDAVTVLSGGSLGVLLAGGSRAVFTADTSAKLTRSGGQVLVSLERGGALITSSPKSAVEGALADLTFRPADAARPSIGWLRLNAAGHVVLYADRGDWLAYTAHDQRSVLLHQGNRLEGSVTAVNQTNDEQRQKKKRKLTVLWIALPLAGMGTGLAFAFGMSECTLRDVSAERPPSCITPVISPTKP